MNAHYGQFIILLYSSSENSFKSKLHVYGIYVSCDLIYWTSIFIKLTGVLSFEIRILIKLQRTHLEWYISENEVKCFVYMIDM